MKRGLCIFFFTISFFLPSFGFAQTNSINAGFVQGIWYSKFPFFKNDTVRIYAGIQNRSGFDIVGSVVFLSDDKEIGTAQFSAINGRFVEVWTDWKAEVGERKMKAVIRNAFKSEAGKSPEAISLGFSEVPGDSIDVDTDIDKNGIGDKEDRKAGKTPEESSVLGKSALASITTVAEDLVEKAKSIGIPTEEIKNVSGRIEKIDEFMGDLAKKVTKISENENAKSDDPTASTKIVKTYVGFLDSLSFLLRQWKWVILFVLLCVIVLWTRRKRRSRYADYDFS